MNDATKPGLFIMLELNPLRNPKLTIPYFAIHHDKKKTHEGITNMKLLYTTIKD